MCAAVVPVIASATRTTKKSCRNSPLAWWEKDCNHWLDGADDKGERRGERSVPRADEVLPIDIDLGGQLRSEGVVRGEFNRNLASGPRGQASGLVDASELGEFFVRHLCKFAGLSRNQRPLAVAPTADRDILPPTAQVLRLRCSW